MLYRIIVLFLLSSTFLFSQQVNAHTKELNKAELSIIDAKKYQLTITLDTLHLIKNYLNFSGEDDELMEDLRKLSISETRKMLLALKAKLARETLINFNQDDVASANANTVKIYKGLTVSALRMLLDPKNIAPQYTTEIYASGDIDQFVSNVSITLPSLLDNVYLTVIHPQSNLLMANQSSQKFSIKPSVTQSISDLDVAVAFVKQGIVHIVPKGLDHILFVVALFLMATSFSTLLWQISLFTLAHTFTLALGFYGVLNIPSNIVEPIIALSIAYVAIENIYLKNFSRWRLPLIFIFGLIHGLGFASVLLELGLPQGQYFISLISFNIGVELGQLFVILISFLVLCYFMKKPYYRKQFVLPLNIAISLVAIFWFLERVLTA